MENADSLYQPHLLLDGLHRLWWDPTLGAWQQCRFGVSCRDPAILCAMPYAMLSPVASDVCVDRLCAGNIAASCQLSCTHGTQGKSCVPAHLSVDAVLVSTILFAAASFFMYHAIVCGSTVAQLAVCSCCKAIVGCHDSTVFFLSVRNLFPMCNICGVVGKLV